jgi:type I restriction enzyme M protein
LLFLQLIMRLLKRPPSPGRAGVVVPNGTLFGDGVCARIKEQLLTEYNLHTIVRLPNGVFAPYTSIPTNLLFFDRTGPTETIWYYEQPLPEGRKSYTKTKPIQIEEFADCIEWWTHREETDRAWTYNFREVYDQARQAAQPHWEAAKVAKDAVKRLGQESKQLESEIQGLTEALETTEEAGEKRDLTARLKVLKQQLKQTRQEEKQELARSREEQAKGDELYWPIFNLDQKNPHGQEAFEHKPPEELVTDIWEKEQRILEILGEIKEVLARKPES